MIVQDGMRRMLQQQEDVFYYVTVMNENYAHPAMPGGVAGALSEPDRESVRESVQQGIRRGMYCLQPTEAGVVPALRLLGSGTILREVLAAAQRLRSEDALAVEVWSVTSFSELQRDGLACEAQSSHAQQPASQPWITQCLAIPQARAADKASAAKSATAPIPTIAATDYVRALPELVRAWVPGPYITLGTDGYGRSDTRAALRAHFRVDAAAIAAAARSALQLTPHPSGSAPA